MLTVRPAAEKDWEAIVRWNENKGEAYLFQWAGFATYQYPLTKEQVQTQAEKDGIYLFVLCDGTTPIGAGEICDINKEAKNKGYGQAFLKELSRIAFAEMGLVSLSLRVYCFNVSAIRCYENAGFRITAFFEEENSHWNNYSMELKP